MNPFLATDGYKTGHHKMYPKGTTLVYSNFTPRNNKHGQYVIGPNGKPVTHVVSFGQQMIVKQIKDSFNKYFFRREEVMNFVKADLKLEFEEDSPISDETLGFIVTENELIVRALVCEEIQQEYSMYLDAPYDVSHIQDLWDLGYLPLVIKAIPEGELVPIGVPILTIYNTKPEFYWLTNFLETILSNLLWKPVTSATIAHAYKGNLRKWAEQTDPENIAFVDFQGHDFSMRGMDSLDAVMASGLGHATSFKGSDSLPVIHAARTYYKEEGFVVGSVNATEHSVMSAGGDKNELDTFRYLMKQFPRGILSIVSDTWNLWDVLTKYLPELKDEILARDGKIVIRPDSGDPADILCGNPSVAFNVDEYMEGKDQFNKHEAKGVIELLWDLFGGTINEQGYKVLDPHIGAIYGDSITLARAEDICSRLAAKGFASTNVVLGIGSYTYQYNTRDTFGFAMKATYVELNGKGKEIFKDPITDDGGKKSAKGLLRVDKVDGEYVLTDQVTWREEHGGALELIFKDGTMYGATTLTEIRNKLW